MRSRSGEAADDPVAIAEAFSARPICGAAAPSIGLDCSGLVQLAVEAAGLSAPRDADMQAAELGAPIDWREGDDSPAATSCFWDGHVGIMTSGTDLLHANAHHMAVEIEPFAHAKERIKQARL